MDTDHPSLDGTPSSDVDPQSSTTKAESGVGPLERHVGGEAPASVVKPGGLALRTALAPKPKIAPPAPRTGGLQPQTKPAAPQALSSRAAALASAGTAQLHGIGKAPPATPMKTLSQQKPAVDAHSGVTSSRRGPLQTSRAPLGAEAEESFSSVVDHSQSSSTPEPSHGASAASQVIGESTASVHNAPTKPPPAAPKVEVQERRSEQTRIFSPNLLDPDLRRSNSPSAAQSESLVDPVIPKSPRVPRSGASAMPLVDDQTRTYSAETIERLLSDDDTASSGQVAPPASPVIDDDVTRVFANPAATAVAEAKRAAIQMGEVHDDITRTFESPLEIRTESRRSPERDMTSPGKRMTGEPLVIITPDAPRHRARSAILLTMVAAIAAVSFVYRAPIAAHSKSFAALVLRGAKSTGAAATPQSAVVGADMVSVSVSVAPAEAVLRIDGQQVPNPYVIKRKSDKLSHLLEAEAKGYRNLTRVVRFERDLTVMLGLAPAAAPATPVGQQVSGTSAETAQEKRGLQAAEAPVRRARKSPSRLPEAEESAPAAANPPGQSGETGSNCSPPYNVDGSGIKTFKPECL